MKQRYGGLLASVLLLLLSGVCAGPSSAKSKCESCAEWNQTQKAFRIYGNTYYVGVHGLSSILITSKEGHVLIDGALPESAAKIVANIRSMGFKIEDVKLILNSHVHDDHAGGIAELQRLSGATVAASASSARVLKSGEPSLDDPQHDIARSLSPVAKVKTVTDGQTLNTGPLVVTAHFTPGHTSGSTSWTWRSCESERCFNLAYVDSLTSVSADGFRFSDNSTYPSVREDFKKSFATVADLPCDVLITPHPEFADLFEKLKKREGGEKDAFLDKIACKKLADRSRINFEKRLAREAD